MLLALLLAAAALEQVEVAVSGAGFTSPDAIRRLMDTRAGDPLDPATLDRDLARLRTTGILYDVRARIEGEGARVDVEAKDRWSLLPVIGFRRGGGRTTARVGVTDHNVLGQLATVYAELTSNADIPFVPRKSSDRIGNLVYAEVPRVFGTRFTPFLAWAREFLDFAAFTDSGAGYIYDRARMALRGELRYELTADLTLMAGAERRRDAYRTSDVSRAPGSPPPGLVETSALAGIQLGYVEDLVSQQRGEELRLGGELATDGTLTGTLLTRAYLIPRADHNLCLQILVQATSGAQESYLFRSGGLREIRGFIDAYFAGATMVRANAEWRWDVLRTNLIVPVIGQLAAFVDGGYVGRRRGAVAGLDYEGPILSVGVGVRGIPVPFARAVFRIDVATGVTPRRTIDVSFSGQQFF